MPDFILKADPDVDMYVEWSSIVDAPCRWGSADQLDIPADRKARADQNGTSFKDGDIYDWNCGYMIVREMGDNDNYTLPRENMLQFLTDLGPFPTKEDEQRALDNNCKRIVFDE